MAKARTDNNPEAETISALDSQVGGDHYRKYQIQPVVFLHRNNIPFIEGEITTHVLRHRDKDGPKDLYKAIHYLQLLLELEYGIVTEKLQ